MGACSKFREDIVLLHIIMEILVGITCKQPVEGIGGTERLIVGELVVETNAYKATLRELYPSPTYLALMFLPAC